MRRVRECGSSVLYCLLCAGATLPRAMLAPAWVLGFSLTELESTEAIADRLDNASHAELGMAVGFLITASVCLFERHHYGIAFSFATVKRLYAEKITAILTQAQGGEPVVGVGPNHIMMTMPLAVGAVISEAWIASQAIKFLPVFYHMMFYFTLIIQVVTNAIEFESLVYMYTDPQMRLHKSLLGRLSALAITARCSQLCGQLTEGETASIADYLMHMGLSRGRLPSLSSYPRTLLYNYLAPFLGFVLVLWLAPSTVPVLTRVVEVAWSRSFQCEADALANLTVSSAWISVLGFSMALFWIANPLHDALSLPGDVLAVCDNGVHPMGLSQSFAYLLLPIFFGIAFVSAVGYSLIPASALDAGMTERIQEMGLDVEVVSGLLRVGLPTLLILSGFSSYLNRWHRGRTEERIDRGEATVREYTAARIRYSGTLYLSSVEFEEPESCLGAMRRRNFRELTDDDDLPSP